MNRAAAAAFAQVVVALLAGTEVRGAAPPAWLIEADASWRPNEPAIQTLDEEQVRYLNPATLQTTVRGIIAVRSDAGATAAAVVRSYDPNSERILSATAWIIAPDGRHAKVIPRREFTDQILHYNQYYWDQERVITFNAAGQVHAGGALAWELTLEEHPGFAGHACSFAPRLPTWRETEDIIPAPGSHLEWYANAAALRQPMAGASPGELRWEADRLRPVTGTRPAAFIPDRPTLFARCSGSDDATWQQFAAKALGIMSPRLDSTGAVKELADTLTAGKTGRWERIRALTEWVQSQIVYLAISLDKDDLAGYRPHPAADILRNRYGDCKDKATLLISLLRASGDDARYVLLYAGDPRLVESHWPEAEFNHAIVAIPADDHPLWPIVTTSRGAKYVIFDPTDYHTPLGVLPESDQGGYALIVGANDGELVRLPEASSAGNRVERVSHARLSPLGRLDVESTEMRYGLVAARQQSTRASTSWSGFQNIVERQIHASNPLLVGFHAADRWEPAAAAYRLDLGFAVEAYGRLLSDGSMMMVRPAILPVNVRWPAWTTTHAGVSRVVAQTLDDRVEWQLPAGFSVEELPEAWRAATTAGQARVETTSSGAAILYHSHLEVNGGFFGPREYEATRALYHDFEEHQQQPVLLRRADHS